MTIQVLRIIRVLGVPYFAPTQSGEEVPPRKIQFQVLKHPARVMHEAGYKHVPRSQPLRIELRKGAKSVVPLADRAIGNLQDWLIGTYHGVSREQLQVYVDEFAQATDGCVPDAAGPRNRAQAHGLQRGP